jgi:hypothetical protein
MEFHNNFLSMTGSLKAKISSDGKINDWKNRVDQWMTNRMLAHLRISVPNQFSVIGPYPEPDELGPHPI